MLRDPITEPSTGPLNSPTLVILKKADASGRKNWSSVDFRKLHDVTIGDSFPIPVISEILEALGNSKYFSTIDCGSGFPKSV
jgi:outer membrane protein assembly factor BamA